MLVQVIFQGLPLEGFEVSPQLLNDLRNIIGFVNIDELRDAGKWFLKTYSNTTQETTGPRNKVDRDFNESHGILKPRI